MSEAPLPDYALPSGAAEAMRKQGLRPTLNVNTVLRCIACPFKEEETPSYGNEILGCSKLKSGNIYPILGRIERAGIATSTQESIDPYKIGRPPRVLYTLTKLGTEILKGSPPLSGCQRRTMV